MLPMSQQNSSTGFDYGQGTEIFRSKKEGDKVLTEGGVTA